MRKIYALPFFCLLFFLPPASAGEPVDPVSAGEPVDPVSNAESTAPVSANEPVYQMTEPLSILEFRRIDKLVFVEATIDGRSGYFLLDTGVGGLTLNQIHFGEDEDLGVMAKITDVNGRRRRARGTYIDSFRWGGLCRTAFYAPLLDLSGLEQILEIEIFGLIGQEVIRDVEVHIDFDRQAMALMRLDDDGRPEAPPYTEAPEHVLPFHLEYYIPVVQARIGELDLKLAFDSGASINMIDRRLKRELPDDARRLMRISYGGAISQNRAPFIAVNALYLDDQFAVTAWRMAATRFKHFFKMDMEIDGLIGADLFRLGGLSINYQRRELGVWINDNIFASRYQDLPQVDDNLYRPTVLASPE